MGAIRGKYIDGKIVLEAPAEWPNGTDVIVNTAEAAGTGGLTEDGWDNSPEGIAAWLAWYDTLQPFLTPEEEAAWKKARAEDRAWELAQWEGRSRRLEKLFE